MFTEEQRNQLRDLAETKKGKKGKKARARAQAMGGQRSRQRYGPKPPSGAQLSAKFKAASAALGDLEGALALAGHASQARDIEHLKGEVQGVAKAL